MLVVLVRSSQTCVVVVVVGSVPSIRTIPLEPSDSEDAHQALLYDVSLPPALYPPPSFPRFLRTPANPRLRVDERRPPPSRKVHFALPLSRAFFLLRLSLSKLTSLRLHAQYPNTPLLLVRSSTGMFFVPSFLHRRSLEPALSVLQAHIPSPSTSSSFPSSPNATGLLVHTFSNGGCFQLRAIDRVYRAEKKEPEGIPAQAFVFDSCPGDTNLATSITAFTTSLRSPVLRFPAVAFVTLFYGLSKLYNLCVLCFFLPSFFLPSSLFRPI